MPIDSPDELVLTYTTKLENASSSPDMTVNGSTTPVDFFDGPTASDEVWFVERISLLLIDGGSMDPFDFGSRSELTNGLLLQARVDSTTYTLAAVYNNVDLITELGDKKFTVTENEGLLDEDDVLGVCLKFNQPLRLEGGQTDRIIFRVQDNLTSIDVLEAAIKYTRPV